MNNKPIIFLLGGAFGSIVTWMAVKKYYQKLANKEIDSVVAAFYKNKDSEEPDEEIKEEVNEDIPRPVSEDSSIVSERKEREMKDYNTIASKYGSQSVAPAEKPKVPYVIEPDIFYSERRYEKKFMTYYNQDNVLVDDDSEEPVNIAETVTEVCLDQIGAYEEDVIHVCDDTKSIMYEVTEMEASYEETHYEENQVVFKEEDYDS